MTTSPPPKRSRLRRAVRLVVRALLIVAALLLLALVLGARWERAEHRAFLKAALDPPGQMVSVGDRDLHVVTGGSGSPSLLFITGLGDDYRGWRDIRAGLEDSVRMVAYDRPGFGWSPAATDDPDLASAVSDARALLSDPELFPQRPIVVGHSLGGMIARELALAHPDLLSGLVLIDATPPESLPWVFETVSSVMYRGLSTLCRAGVMRWMLYRTYPDLTREEQLRTAHLDASGAKCREVWRELREYLGGVGTPQSPGAMGALPLTVLSAEAQTAPVPGLSRAMDRLNSAKEKVTDESARGRFVGVETGHYIHWEAPDTVVAEILKMVREVRADSTG